MVSLFPPTQTQLPDFSTLLIAGPYHSSAPIHLALSSNVEISKSKTVIFAPSRSTLRQDLQQFNDSWLATHSGDGATSELTSNITMFYPPTPAHLCLLLSMLQVPNGTSVAPDRATPQIIQATAPNLIIFVNLSQYFLPSEEGESPVPSTNSMAKSTLTISSYIALLNRILVLISSLKEVSSGLAPKFVLFDSRIQELKLPVANQSLFHEESGPHPQPKQILPVIEKLFEWVAIFEDDPSYVPSSQTEETIDDEGIRKQLRVYCMGKLDADRDQIINWQEVIRPSSFSYALQETHFATLGVTHGSLP